MNSLQFDDLNTIPEQRPFTPVGTYVNISFTDMYFNPAFAGLTAQSAPNYALAFGSASIPATMTTAYAHSTVESFALDSFYYGCLVDAAHPDSSLPVPCNITATGYAAGGSAEEPVAVQEFVYAPAAARWTATLAFGSFDEAFRGLERVAFVRSPAKGTAFVLDNVVGTTLS